MRPRKKQGTLGLSNRAASRTQATSSWARPLPSPVLFSEGPCFILSPHSLLLCNVPTHHKVNPALQNLDLTEGGHRAESAVVRQDLRKPISHMA